MGETWERGGLSKGTWDFDGLKLGFTRKKIRCGFFSSENGDFTSANCYLANGRLGGLSSERRNGINFNVDRNYKKVDLSKNQIVDLDGFGAYDGGGTSPRSSYASG